MTANYPLTAIKRAIEFCKAKGYQVGHHPRGVTKMITFGKGKPTKRSWKSRPAVYRIRHRKYEKSKSHFSFFSDLITNYALPATRHLVPPEPQSA